MFNSCQELLLKKEKRKKKKSVANHICTGEDNSERNVIVRVEVVESFET